MFYLIQKRSGKITEQGEKKSPLRRTQKAMKNPTAYSISKNNVLTGPGKKAAKAANSTKVKKAKQKKAK